jgi:hypothetical protein
LHHQPADRLTAGEHQVVDPGGARRLDDLRSTLQDRDRATVEVLGRERGEHAGRRGGKLGRLDRDAVAGGERPDHRRQ